MAKPGKKLPPRQRAIKNILKWGTDHPTITGFVPKLDLENWFLAINGEVKTALKLSWDAILQLPKVEVVSDFHCVEGWSVLSCKWEGVPFTQILELASPTRNAKYVTLECADGYTTSLSIEELLEANAILAYKLNDKLLEEGLGAPLRLVIPPKYAYKSAMWLSKIMFTAKKEQGYWEKRGYSDTADVWKDDRFSK